VGTSEKAGEGMLAARPRAEGVARDGNSTIGKLF